MSHLEYPGRKPSVWLIASACLLSGCIAVRGDDLPAFSKWPLGGGVAIKSITLLVSGSNTNQRAMQLIEGQAQKAYTDSILFSHVSVSKEPSDVLAEVRITEEGSKGLAFLSGFICGLSLYIIPGYANATLSMETVFRGPTGTVMGSKKNLSPFPCGCNYSWCLPCRSEMSQTM